MPWTLIKAFLLTVIRLVKPTVCTPPKSLRKKDSGKATPGASNG